MRLLEPDDPALAPATDRVTARAHLLAAHGDGVDEATRAAMVAFLDAHPDALLRTCAPGHLTGSAMVVDATAARVLVLLHRKLQRWLQPGGHLDGEANLAASALREATEETGISGLRVALPAIDLDIHRVAPPNEPAHDHLDVRYLVVAPPDATVTGNHESLGLRWVTLEELLDLAPDPNLVRLATNALAAGRTLLQGP